MRQRHIGSKRAKKDLQGQIESSKARNCYVQEKPGKTRAHESLIESKQRKEKSEQQQRNVKAEERAEERAREELETSA